MSHHADTSLVPENIQSKTEFWEHIHEQLSHLLAGQQDWVSNLANAASLIYSALHSFPAHFGTGEKQVNWCGFYIHSRHFPPKLYSQSPSPPKSDTEIEKLLLGPFCGKPACQFITVAPPKSAKGVCSAAFIQRQTILVPNVDEYPGHIACDGETKSEIVCPLILKRPDGESDVALGVLDLDCLAVGGFDDHDKAGLEKIAQLVVASCTW